MVGLEQAKPKHVETTGSRTRLNIVRAIQLGHIAEAMTGPI